VLHLSSHWIPVHLPRTTKRDDQKDFTLQSNFRRMVLLMEAKQLGSQNEASQFITVCPSCMQLEESFAALDENTHHWFILDVAGTICILESIKSLLSI